MNNIRTQLLTILKSCAQHGNITLASGKKSNFYINCKQVLFQGESLRLLGKLFYSKLLKIEEMKHSSQKFIFTACAGMELGAIPMICALSMYARQKNRTLNAIAIRKNPKGYGTNSFLEGEDRILQNSKIIILEDVITTGYSSILAANRLRDKGLVVEDIIALIDRKEHKKSTLTKEGLNLHSIYDINDFQNTTPKKLV